MPGPTPGARCAVCNSPDRQHIEQADLDGVSRREIARRYGLGKDVVSRHFYNGHTRPDPSTAPPEDLPDPDEVPEIERLKITRAILVKELEREARSDTAREIRQISERIASLSGEHRAKTARVQDVEGLPELIAAWFKALEPYPEARDAMLAATPKGLLDEAPDVEA